MKIGCSVKVKPNLMDPDFEAISLGGFQGRVFNIRPQNNGTTVIDIRWDSITLQHMPRSHLKSCYQEGLDWSEMTLYPDDIEITTARDAEQDVMGIKNQLDKALTSGWS